MKFSYLRLLLLGCCWAVALLAQGQTSIQQLKKTLATASADSTRSRLLLELGIQYEQTSLDSCFYFLNQSLQTAQRSHDAYATARTMHRMSYTHLYLIRDESNALEWANKGIAVAKPVNDYVHLAKCYQLLSIISNHQGIGNFEELSKQAFLYAQKSNNWQVLADSYGYMADLYLHAKNYRQAEIMTEKAMPVIEKHDLDWWVSVGIDYIDLLKKNGKPEQARLISQKLAFKKDKLQKSRGEWIYLNDIAKIETELKNYNEAERLLLEGIIKEGQKAKADTLHLSFFYQNLTNLYVAKGDYKKAYESGMALADIRQWLKDKRQTQDSKLQMTQLKAKLDLEKKEAEIALLAEQKKEQKIMLIAALLVGALLIVFVLALQRNRRRIERQKVELTSLNTTKDKLFAILSHDLRAPVKSLGSYFMLINWGALSQAEFAESVQSLNAQLSNVYDMLDNVLNWAISQMGGIRTYREQVTIAPIVEDQIALLSPIAATKGIQLSNHIPSETMIHVDKNQMSVIFRNLLQNAIKFTNSGGTISINHTEKEGVNYFEVQDTGIGMSKERLAKLFQLDKQTSSPGTALEQGTGLGLVLVKELVELNGGSIAVESQLDKGTTFTLAFNKKELP